MKPLSFAICLSVSLFCRAQDAPTPDQVAAILETSTKSFSEFVDVVVQVPLPPLTLPKSNGPMQPIDNVSSQIWKRVSGVDFDVTKENKRESLQTLKSLGILRDWLLLKDAYPNLLFATFIEREVAISTLDGLSKKVITVTEAEQVLAGLAKEPTAKSVLAMLERHTPESSTLIEIKASKNDTIAIRDLAWRLSKEEHRDPLDLSLSDMLENVQLSTLTQYIGNSSTISHFTKLLVKYTAKGGDINQPYEQLTADVERLMPEAIGMEDPGSGAKIEAAMFSALMETIRNRKLRH